MINSRNLIYTNILDLTQKPSEHFKIIQNRKGHRRKDNLSYLLLHGNNQPMIWVDINGQTHHGIPTPHAHVFTDEFTNGEIAIPIDRLSKHLSSTQVVSSFLEFLKYNNFTLTLELLKILISGGPRYGNYHPKPTR